MIKSGTVQNGAELGAPGDEYNKSPCREGRPRLLKDKTHCPTTPSGIHSFPKANHACAPRWLKMRENIHGLEKFMFHEPACLFSDWDFRKKILFFLGRSEAEFAVSLLPCHFTMKERWWRLLFPKTMCTYHRFLFPFSSKFSDLNFASYVPYNLPVLCRVSHTVSLGYLWADLCWFVSK